MIKEELLTYLRHVSEIYEDLDGTSLEVAICGGTALNLSGLLERPTKDVDIVYPEFWPETFSKAVYVTSQRFALKPDWMNRGPVDLLRMGLPQGYFDRCESLKFYNCLTFLITSRLDQIHFKLYACIDRGGYHVDDLKALGPSQDELCQAAIWCFTHDVSEGFRKLMFSFFEQMGWHNVVQRLEK